MSWNPSPTSPLQSDASARPSTLPAALLTQAFIWMFAGLLLTAGVAAVVQTSSGLLEFAKSNFMPSGPFGLLLSIAGVIIFTALTAYNVQRIQAGDLVARYGSVEKAAVIGALALYLDFVNIFLFLLRIFGSRR